MNVLERDKKKVCIELKTRQDFDLQDDDWYEGRDPSAYRLNEELQACTEEGHCIDRRHGATGDYGSRTRGNWVVEYCDDEWWKE